MPNSTRFFFRTDRWKKTALGRDISLSANAPLNELVGARPIVLLGGIHGDEPEGVELARATESWLQQESSRPNSRLAPWVVVPCLNVDGFEKRQRVNGRGVDLNRNYPSKNWSPEVQNPRYHPGPAPASEPEIQAVVELVETLDPRLLIHCHSWEPMIVGTGPRAVLDAQRLVKSSGYKFVETIGYPTPGSLSQYGWHDKQIPVICIEEQEHLKDLGSIWPRFAPGIHEIFSDLSDRRTPGSHAGGHT